MMEKSSTAKPRTRAGTLPPSQRHIGHETDPVVVEARQRLFGFIRRGIKYELSKMRNLLERLGHPEDKLRWIHVAGTNGKGSVAAALEGILLERGVTVGLTTSPHLVSVLERYRINGEIVAGQDFAEAVDRVCSAAEELGAMGEDIPTFFEMAVATAFVLFAQAGLEWGIAEVGLGGRLDATNVLNPELSVITNIAKDHPKTLGGTLELIAAEKCGIIKRDVPVVCGIDQPEIQSIARDFATRNESPLTFFDEACEVRNTRLDIIDGSSFDLQCPTGLLEGLRTPLLGAHQARNAALAALAALQCPGLDVTGEHVRRGISRTSWPCRFEVVGRDPIVIFDGGHNQAGAAALVSTYRAVMGERKCVVLCGFSGDKAVPDMLECFAPIAESFVFTRSTNYRAAAASDLKKGAQPCGLDQPMKAIEDPGEALSFAKKAAGPAGVVLGTGSIYLLGDLLAAMRGVRAQAITG